MRLTWAALMILLATHFAFAQTTRPAAPTTASTAMGKDRIPHPAPIPGKTLELSIEELGNFEYDADTDTPIPADVKALSGTTVRLTGFMIPIDQAQYITKFALEPTFDRPNWAPLPLTQQVIVVNCPKDKPTQYCADRIVIEGKLTVNVVKDDGHVVCIFTVDDASVKPASK